MRALVSKIDEYAVCSNYEVSINNYKDYYEFLDCSLFDIVNVEWNNEHISLFVDDEGMLKPQNMGREVEGYPNPLFGNIVVTGGVDEKGDTLPAPEWLTTEKLEIFISKVKYITR